MLAAYLVKDQGLDARTAIKHVRRLRPYSVETYQQEGAVLEYAAKLKASQAGTSRIDQWNGNILGKLSVTKLILNLHAELWIFVISRIGAFVVSAYNM